MPVTCPARRAGVVRLAVAVAAVLAAAPAAAVASYTTFLVTLAVQATCSVSVTPLVFGSYSGTTIDATSTITATCNDTTGYYVNINAGLAYGPGYIPRMQGPNGALLSYSPYRDAARTLFWGGSYNYDGVAATGNGNPQVLTVYARLPGNQLGNPGSYTDTLVVTVTY